MDNGKNNDQRSSMLGRHVRKYLDRRRKQKLLYGIVFDLVQRLDCPKSTANYVLQSAKLLDCAALEDLYAIFKGTMYRDARALFTFLHRYFPRDSRDFSHQRTTAWIHDMHVHFDDVEHYMRAVPDRDIGLKLSHHILFSLREEFPNVEAHSDDQTKDLIMASAALAKQLYLNSGSKADLNSDGSRQRELIMKRSVTDLIFSDHETAMHIKQIIEDEAVFMEAQLLARLQGASLAVLDGAL